MKTIHNNNVILRIERFSMISRKFFNKQLYWSTKWRLFHSMYYEEASSSREMSKKKKKIGTLVASKQKISHCHEYQKQTVHFPTTTTKSM